MKERKISLSRRRLFEGVAAGTLLLTGFDGRANTVGGELITPYADHHGAFGMVRLGAERRVLAHGRLPGRAHDFMSTPSGDELLVMERRPGRRAWIVDIATCRVVRQIEAGADRHFEGHAIFSRDGLLLTTENDYVNGRGVIGVRDGRDWRVLGEFASHGIGPHELMLMPDGKTLAVANGGILTHPGRPRENLNLDTMRSTLSYLDVANGRLVSEWLPSDPSLSIRHFDVTPAGEVVLGMQFEGMPTMVPAPLLARHDGRNELRYPDNGEDEWESLSGYVGSVRLAPDGSMACATSPRGGMVMLWDLASNRLIRGTALDDVCGVAFDSRGALEVSTGTGRIQRLPTEGAPVARSVQVAPTLEIADWHFDNHMRILNR